jgi:hypothetical protein
MPVHHVKELLGHANCVTRMHGSKPWMTEFDNQYSMRS